MVRIQEQALIQAGNNNERVYEDMHGKTEALGPKIYAQRAAPRDAPRYLREMRRTVGISFNWSDTVNYRRCGTNACSFIWRPGVQGSHGSFEAAYRAACDFMAQPSVPEGEMSDRPVWDGSMLSLPSHVSSMMTYSVSNMGMSAKAVLACLTLSLFVFVSYTTVLMLEDELGCTRSSGKSAYTSMFNGVNPVCQNLTDLKNHVQRNSTEYINLLFSQLKIGFVLLARYIIDEMFR